MEKTDSKSKELTIIKGQMVNVISNLKSKHHLDEIMPLLNLLKTLETYINTIHTKECRNWNALNICDMKLKLGPETIGITHKISFLFNRIHIESAYLASINKSVAYGIKKYYKRKDINQFVQEKTYAIEKKKLFILSLKLILRDNTSINTTGLNLDYITSMLLENIDSGIGSLMRTINKNCEICAQENDGQLNKTDRFCFCKIDSMREVVTKRYSGVLKFSLYSFMGLYEADYLDKMLKENAPRLTVDQFKSEGGSKHKRRCVVIVKEKCVFSSWTHSALSISGEMAISKVKDIEIQVWEASSKQGGHDRIVAVAIVPLCSLFGENNDNSKTHRDSITISLEPDGFVMCRIRLESVDTKCHQIDDFHADTNKENKPICVDAATAVYKKFGVKRRANIFSKLGGYRLARHIEANVPVSVWTDWFQNHIDRLAIPVDHDDSRNMDDKDNKTLRLNKNKVVITPGGAVAPKKPFNASYRPLSQSPLPAPRMTPKFNRTNPRAICKFITFDKEPASQYQDKMQALQLTPSFPASAFHSAVVSTPLSGKMQPRIFHNGSPRPNGGQLPACAQSPIPPSKLAFPIPRNAIKYYNVRKSSAHKTVATTATMRSIVVEHGEDLKSNLLTNKSMTRSNIELANESQFSSSSRAVKKSESLASKYESDDDSDYEDLREANILSKNVLKIPFNVDESREWIPYACSPDLQKIPVCKLLLSGQKQFDNSVTSNITEKAAAFRSWGSYCDQSSYQSDRSSSEAFLSGKHSFAATHEPTFQEEKSLLDDSDDDDSTEDNLTSKALAFDDFELLCVLGQGHFGKVLLARHADSGAVCALKSIQKSRASTEAEYDSLLAERRILMMITESHHPFLVGLIGCFQTDRYLVFAMEYASGGDLMGHIHKEPFPEDVAAFYTACIVLAFEFLHERDIIYRDLKLDNVLMDSQGYAKLTDFGLSKENMKWNDFTSTFCGTPEFLAPEIISLQKYTRAIDWWALGVLIYEMIISESPFPGDEDDEIFNNIIHTTPDMKDLSPEALSIVIRLLQQNPEKRLGYGEDGSDRVKMHPFFRKIDWQELYCRHTRCPFVPTLNNEADTKYFESEFTSKPLTIDHDEPSDDAAINDELFLDFDTVSHHPHFS